MRKRVYIAYTGGTIGMRKTADGYAPEPGYLAQQIAGIPELKSPSMPAYEVHEYSNLLDSANMTPEDWLKIARDIERHYEAFDGFVVLHGTDTMAYTASALPFMLEGLRKPVVLTGAQIPLCEVRNDARENLITAMIIAGDDPIPEVLLCFGSKLLRGCRSVKVDASGFDAFDSPNESPLGRVGVKISIDRDRVLPPPEAGCPLRVRSLDESEVAVLRLFPGISPAIVDNTLQPPLKGAVLETYGLGNGPSHSPELIGAIRRAVDRGVVVVNCTQCLKGSVDMGGYATGSALLKAGVISGWDMTLEAALAKMFFLLSRGLPVAEVKHGMQLNLHGELSRSEG
jgi:L-asparaginase